MKLIFQIFTGDLTAKSLADPQMILDKLQAAQAKGKLAGVLCGWSTDREFYQTLGEQLHRWGVPLYLKIAVFSELKGCRRFDPLIDYTGKPAEPYVLNPQESFEFRCPASAFNRQALTELYNEAFSDLPIDGIFLDRVRYPSPLSSSAGNAGVAGIGGCFCPECQKRYAQAGIDVEKLRARLAAWQAGETPQLTAYEKGRWQVDDPELNRLFQVKTEVITEALREYAEAFHAKGLKIGFDLFTPALGYFCGQDVQKLREIADFVKPMMYRYTDAPAGLPFERRHFVKTFGAAAGEQFAGLAGSGAQSEEELMRRELLWLMQEPGCPVWPGIEANYIEPIALIGPEQIRRNLEILESVGCGQMVASWNLAKIPEENMRALC